MTEGEATPPRPRPRPSHVAALPAAEPPERPAGFQHEVAGRDDAQDLVATAGAALVTAGRVGRLLGRSGWRMARQLPGVAQAEKRGRRIGHAAAVELQRLLEPPRVTPSVAEQHAARLAAQASTDAAPLRTAMAELLSRSHEASGAQSREYLFGTIVSQIVPDEARILSALATGGSFAVVDVVAKYRSGSRAMLSNVSDVGSAAGVSLPDNVSTYLTRLDGYGLLVFGRDNADFQAQYRRLEDDQRVRDTVAAVERTRQSAKIVRKTVGLSQLGREFWAACAPRR